MKLIPLGGREGAGKVALVDDDDFDRVDQFRWHLRRDKPQYDYCRVIAKIEGRAVSLGQFILGAEAGIVDHINRDPLDNRRHNLRPATPSQNAANRRAFVNNQSGYKGVSRSQWHQNGNLRCYWQVDISCQSRRYRLGYFHDIVEAAQNYDAFARLLQGEFAVLNFPDCDYTDFTPKRLDLYRQLQEELTP